MSPRVAVPPTLSPAAFERRRPGAAIIDLGGDTMGTSWSARVVMPDAGVPRSITQEIEQEFARIIDQMSHFHAHSHLCRFNNAPLESWQQLPPEFSHVLETALQVGEASAGAFTPTLGRLAELWGFGPSGSRQAIPEVPALAAALAESQLGIEHDPALLRARRMAPAALDFSGIAKGYTVDRMAARLRAMGLPDFLVELGGELLGEGIRPDGQPWWVMIEPPPGAAEAAPTRVALHGLAIATSGDYIRYFEKLGRRYSHTIDPRTGWPVDNGVASVSVLHRECMLADAWATALTVLGAENGMAVAEREGLAVTMLVREGDGARELISPAFQAMLD